MLVVRVCGTFGRSASRWGQRESSVMKVPGSGLRNQAVFHGLPPSVHLRDPAKLLSSTSTSTVASRLSTSRRGFFAAGR